jgi:alkylation response protein AidB-like acyl-CoA dehydrogenase
MTDLPKGGSFLLGKTDPQSIFTPEDFTDEHKMILRTTLGFVKDRVQPNIEDIEAKKPGLSLELLQECAELGLLGTDVPEEYDGFQMDKISTCIIAERMGWAGSFMLVPGTQSGIGQLPLVFFGTPEQKQKYLPGTVSAEIKGAYALTEPEAGSDAMACRSWATLTPDGDYYVLNGTKQFITSAGYADFFIVFAKIDREKFTGFIVDRATPGVTVGPEEHKMGIKGSSTTNISFEDVKVPASNVLYEIGKGHVIAFNVLNMGRFKLAGNTLGMSKYALELSTVYANERKQFNVPISAFGMIREKLAEMATRIYVTESMVYRTGGLLDGILHSLDLSGANSGQLAATGIEEYALECSINKVWASEACDYIVDQGVQIFGGYGFSADYPIERLYRDSRVFRIFEGTNEINRIVIVNTLLRRGLKGDIPLETAMENIKALFAAGSLVRENEEQLVQAAKDILLFTLGAAIEKHGKGLQKNQEVVGRLADLAIQAFAWESAWLRAQKAVAKEGEAKSRLKVILASTAIYSNVELLVKTAREIVSALAEGDELTGLLARLQQLSNYVPKDTIALRQEIAAAINAAGKYPSAQ